MLADHLSFGDSFLTLNLNGPVIHVGLKTGRREEGDLHGGQRDHYEAR
jgi:hypothetical protein